MEVVTLRLLWRHYIRRSLIEPNLSEKSIYDIFAEHGFCDWSHFTRQYRQHFFELHSQTVRLLVQGQPLMIG